MLHNQNRLFKNFYKILEAIQNKEELIQLQKTSKRANTYTRTDTDDVRQQYINI